MSQKYISTQNIKGKKIIYQNLQAKKYNSQINFHRINTNNNFQTNYTFVKEYLKTQNNKDNKQTKEFSLGHNKLAQNIRKGEINLKKKNLATKTNSESNEQIEKEDTKKRTQTSNYRLLFTHTFLHAKKPSKVRYNKDSGNNNLKKENNQNIMDLINMSNNNHSDNSRKKRNVNTSNHLFLYLIITEMAATE